MKKWLLVCMLSLISPLSPVAVYGNSYYFGQDFGIAVDERGLVSDYSVLVEPPQHQFLDNYVTAERFALAIIDPTAHYYDLWYFEFALEDGYQPGRYDTSELSDRGDFYLQHLGFNLGAEASVETTGYLELIEVELDSKTGIPLSLAVNFNLDIHHSYYGDETYFGALRYNSDAPIHPVPVPAALGLFVSALGLISVLRRKRYPA